MPGQFVQGFTTQSNEINITELPVNGEIPSWLAGTLVRNGPGQFEVGETRFTYRHWFDGLAMLHSFTIADGQVSYANRYLQSRAYQEDNTTGKLNYSGFASDPCRRFFSRVASIFNPPQPGENAVVNVAQLADQYIAMTESPMPMRFDPKTLETLGALEYQDEIEGQLATAHPHFDFERGVGYNHMVHFGAQTHYIFYSLTDKNRTQVSKLPVKNASYVHSFGMTENYLILAEFSLRLYKMLDLAFGKRPFIENFEWRDDDACFHIVDKVTGDLVTSISADAFFSFHHINAYEQGDTIILDICAYEDTSLIDDLYLEQLHQSDGLSAIPEIRRYILPMHDGRATYTVLTDENFELPRINYRKHNGRDYTYAYGSGVRRGMIDFPNQLVKLNVKTGETHLWYESGCYPGEGVFIAAPDATQEDEGVILSVVLDTNHSKSFLLILNATDFTEIARATVPQHVPFGFHGQFFTDI
ncbi:MAG: carotenoid oxygenase family protein [Aggregatilineales bacterium]